MITPGDKVKASHPYCYRPEGCEEATVTHMGIDENGRMQIGVIFDNGITDYAPLSDFFIYYDAVGM